MIPLTNEQQKQLLLLTDAAWKRLKSLMKNHYKLGGCMASEFPFLLALTSEQWQTVDMKLSRLRVINQEALQTLRRDTRKKQSRQNKTEYMRSYMQRYRQQQGASNGQISDQGSG